MEHTLCVIPTIIEGRQRQRQIQALLLTVAQQISYLSTLANLIAYKANWMRLTTESKQKEAEAEAIRRQEEEEARAKSEQDALMAKQAEEAELARIAKKEADAKAAADQRLQDELAAKAKAEEEARAKLEEDARRQQATPTLSTTSASTVPAHPASSQVQAFEQILERYQSTMLSRFESLEHQNKILQERLNARDFETSAAISDVATLQVFVSSPVDVVKKGEERRIKAEETERLKELLKAEKKLRKEEKKKKKQEEEDAQKAREAAERDIQLVRLTELTSMLTSRIIQTPPPPPPPP